VKAGQRAGFARWYHLRIAKSVTPVAYVRLSSNLFPLLRLLADGEIHSGRDLSAALAVPPGVVRSGMRAVERLGLRVHRLRGKGYRLDEPLDLLDGERLASLVDAAFVVELLDQCPSTNGVLMERARLGVNQPLVLACEHQTAGRGRRGNRWQSGIGTDLTFSILWNFAQTADKLSGLSLALGVALVRALEGLGYPGVLLKWPNDLVLRGRKLGGILIEVTGQWGGASAVVVGIGLNLRWDDARSAAVDQPATGLFEASETITSRTTLLAGLLIELHSALERFAAAGFAPFRDDWLRYHVWQGRRVVLTVAQRTVVDGEAVGIDDNGALLVRSARGVECFHSGELRLARR